MKATPPFGAGSLENEWGLLCACCAPGADSHQVAKRLRAGINWPVLLELAEEHGVLGIVATRLRESNYDQVPPAAQEKLQTRLRAQHLFTLGMTAELFRILEEFAKAGIETLLVKGPLLSLRAYGDPAVRSFVDLDLLIRHKEVLRATEHMIAMGFEEDVPLGAIRAGKVPGEYLFKRSGTKRLVELHTERTFRYYPRPMRLEDLFARQTRVRLDTREIPALSLEDELLLNCIHGAKHFWERLIYLADVAAIVARHPEIDWGRTCQSAKEVEAERMLRVALQLGKTILGLKVPERMAAGVARDAAAKSLSQQIARWLPQAGFNPPPLPQRAFFRLSIGGGGAVGILYLLRLSLSPTEEDWVEGAEGRRSWFWDAVRRPLRLIRKYGPDG